MNRPPWIAVALTGAGIIPFLWGTLIASGMVWLTMGDPADGGYPIILAADGATQVISYGIVILSFMTGVFWGFATKGTAQWPYVVSVLPALFVFFAVAGRPVDQLNALIFGFAVLLFLDWVYQRNGLAPLWWLTLRAPISIAVLVCLTITRITL